MKANDLQLAISQKYTTLTVYESKPVYLPNLSLTQSLSGSWGELFGGSRLIGLVSAGLETGTGKGVVAGIGFAGLGGDFGAEDEEVEVFGDVE